MKWAALLFISLLTYLPASGQFIPPTLTGGLATVTDQPGLDLALLSEIISAKQTEVKHELIQRTLLKNLNGTGYALQNYIYTVFHTILTYHDARAIEKELLAQTTILAFQLGFAETLLRLSYSPGVNPASSLTASLHEYLSGHYGLNQVQLEVFDKDFQARLNKSYFARLFHIDNDIYASVQSIAGPVAQADRQFTYLIMDTVYEAMRRSETLNQLGFVKMHPDLSRNYSGISLYQNEHATPASADFLLFVQSAMDMLVKYHGLFHEFINDRDVTIADLALSARATLPRQYNLADSVRKASLLLEDFYQGVQTAADNVQSYSVGLADEIDVVLTEMWQFEQRNPGSDAKVSVNDFYFITEIAEPLVTKLLAAGILDDSAWNSVAGIKHAIYSKLLDELLLTLDGNADFGAMSKIPIDKYGHLIRIITSLSKLDEIGSYEHLFQSLAQIGLDARRTEVKYLKDIIYFLESFTRIDRAHGAISVDVEALLLKLLNIYDHHASRDMQLYFSVGAGQTFKLNQDPGFELINQAGEPIQSLAFGSEKIGLKFKLLNHKRIRASDPWELNTFQRLFYSEKNPHRSETPVISDIYAYGFGSGLLYSVANLTTAGAAFDHPMVGGGIGIAFFNSLDFNVWRVSPIPSGESLGTALGRRAFWGFSFDIKLTEYLSAVAERKRKH